MKFRKLVLPVLGGMTVAFALAACGGGGGGGGGGGSGGGGKAPTTPVAIDAANAESIAVLALETLDGVADLGEFGDFYIAADAAVDVSKQKRSLFKLAEKAYAGYQRLNGAGTDSVIGATEVFPCDKSGRVVESWSETSAKVTYDNCDDGDGEVWNGSISFRLNSELETEVSMTLTFDNLKISVVGYPTTSINGAMNMRMWQPSDSSAELGMELSGSLLSYQHGDWYNDLRDFKYTLLTDESWREEIVSNYTYASTELGGAITVKTEEKVVIDRNVDWSGYPTSGTVKVIGANGSSVTIEFVLRGVHLSVDEDGDGSPEIGPDLYTWEQLEAAAAMQ